MRDNLVSDIIHASADAFGTTEAQILSYDRTKAPVAARTLAMALAQEKYTLGHVASLFNRQDHTTIIAAKRRADVLTRRCPDFRAKATAVLQRLKKQ